MKFLIMTIAALAVVQTAGAQSCEPNYQAMRQNCDAKQMHQGVRPQKGTKVEGEERHGDELAAAYCSSDIKDLLAKQWSISPSDIRLESVENKTTDELYGQDIQHPLGKGRKKDIICYYVATGCPIVNAVDTNGCFAKHAAVSEDSINQKINEARSITSQDQAWTVAQFLLDAGKGNTDSYSLSTVKGIDKALYNIVKNPMSSSTLSEYIKAENPATR